MIKVDTEKYNEIFSRIAEVTFEKLNLSGEAVAEADFVTKEEIRDLNARTRGIDKVTDVLSYPTLDEYKPFAKENYPYDFDVNANAVNIGCIVICEDVANEQAEEYGHSPERENCYLFTHGLLHLLGYDHIEESDRAVMREKEEAVLSELKINR